MSLTRFTPVLVVLAMPAEVRAVIDTLLAEPLSVSSAMQVALLNSPRQATSEVLGTGQVDLVQAWRSRSLAKSPLEAPAESSN